MTDPAATTLLPRDTGLQAERTALSWSRTGLSVLANALLALRSGWTNQDVVITIFAFVLLIASGAAVLYGAYRRRHLLSGSGPSAPSAIAITAAAVITLVTCLVGTASIVVR